MTDPRQPLSYLGEVRPGEPADQAPVHGQASIVLAAAFIGLILMTIQLWLLTVALDLYLGGRGKLVWQLALASGVIFVGGLLMLRLIHRRPHVGRGHFASTSNRS